jgi:hypothetical protein
MFPKSISLQLAILTLYVVLNIAFAQSTSSISGIVSDTSGAVVPGAVVTITNEETGISNVQTTTEAGLYSFPALPVGNYTVTLELKGFKTARKTKNVLVVNTPLAVDVALEVGETAEVVTVEASAELVQTSDAAIGNVVTQKAIVELPLNGRNPLALLVVEPGVVQRSNGAGGTGVHVNGSRDMAHNVTIDGIEANESSVNNPLNNVYRLTPDNVQEYKVTTSNATAQEGRNSGASVSVATRRGTNQFHGTLFEFFRNTALNSNEFFANALGTPKPDIKLNQYGIGLSGPIVKNHSFFFFSWQGQKVNFAQPVDQVFGTPSLYTASARSGVYRYWRHNPANPLRIGNETIMLNSPLLVDPITGALREGIRQCATPSDLGCVASFNFAAADPRGLGIDPVIKQFMDQRPLPNNFSAGDGLNTATYLWNPPTQVRGPAFTGRIDHAISESHAVFGRYIHSDNDTLGGDPNNSRPVLYPGLPPMGEVFRASKNLAIGYRWVVSPRLINELTLGFSRFGFLFTQGEANPDWPNLPSYARTSGTGTASAFNSFDPGIINTPRTYRVVTTPQILNNTTFVTGAHILKAGFNFRFYRHNDQRGQPGGINVTPLTSFSRTVRPPQGFDTPSMDATDSNRLLGTINDVIGIPARLSQTFLGDLNSDTFLPFRSGDVVNLWSMGHRMKQYNVFFQDEWKVRRNLTLNLGVRWELNAPPKESHGRVYVPDRPVTGSTGLVTFVNADAWYDRMNWGAIAPRIAIAWAPWQDTVIRTGYGIAFDTLSSFQVTAVSGRVPGLTVQCLSTVGQAPSSGCGSVPDRRIGEGFPNELPTPTLKPSQYLTPEPQLLTSAPALTVFEPQLKVPTVHQWNFSIQREIAGSLAAEVAYVARRGTRLFRAYDINQINSDPILPSFIAMQQNRRAGCQPSGAGCPGGVTGRNVPLVTSGVVTAAFVNSMTTQNELGRNEAGTFAGRVEQQTLAAKLRPNQQFAQILYIDSGGDSYYHSLQTRLRKRFSKGGLFGIAYTFGKSIDNQSVDPVASNSGGGLSTTNSRTPTDIRNWRSERARSDFDRTHTVMSNFVYELPFGGNASGILKQLIGGWSLNGLYTFMSGEPFSVRSGVRTANYSHESIADIIGPKPEVKLQQKDGVIGPAVFANANGFAFPAPGSNGAGRNLFTAPSYWNMDLSVIKRFHVTERISMQFRTEMFNAFNHANFDNPRDASVGSPSITSTLFGQTCCATVAPPSTRNIVQTGESARVIQFAVKVDF